MTPLSIDEMKEIELELMDELESVCKAHGLTCFLGYGSLLGAVRHGGFIPWDDDMDVVMMRRDYEQLIAHFDEWKSSDRFALASYRDGSSIYQFAKLVDTTTVVYENFVGKSDATGVWVDVFPLEGYDSKVAKSVFRKNTRTGLLRSFVVADPATGSTPFVKLVKRIVCPLVRGFDVVRLSRKLDENARRLNDEASGAVVDVLGDGDSTKVFPRNLFVPVPMKFENRTYTAPAGYEEYLSIQYGDWQTPPPENAREVHVLEAYRL